MKLRTEIVNRQGEFVAMAEGGFEENVIALEHDAMAAHALLQAMEEFKNEEAISTYYVGNWIRLRADEILKDWTKQDEGAK